jgi:hypothetical protein
MVGVSWHDTWEEAKQEGERWTLAGKYYHITKEVSVTHPSKRKGNHFERELVALAEESGLTAKRAWGSNGEALGHHAEVDLMIDSKRIQAKRRKALPGYLQPNENVDAVAFRQDRGEPLVLITLWEYFDLLKAAEVQP